MNVQGKDAIEQIRLHSDIVETIGRYIPLKKAGHRFRGLCPFHKEKTPSFHVDPDKQLFHCFGCHAGGDVFSFVMQYENVEFPEAARILADRAGIQYEPRAASHGQVDRSEKARLYELHADLAAYYADRLANDPAAARARDYLQSRDLMDAVEPFQLGFAPVAPNACAKWAQKKGYSQPLMEQAGVLLPSDRGGDPYDRFKGRLMFPIHDEQGRIVGFSGRILDQSSPAKYVNSPETLLFKKSRILYGLNRARQDMVDRRQAIVCEGQIDVIRCQLAGFTNAAAPQGTALTDSHARLLKRYADEVVLVFDADTAGQNAALRSAELLLAEGLSVRVASLPEKHDPDSLLREKGEGVFRQYLLDAQSLVSFHLNIQRDRGELDSEAGRLRAIRTLLEIVQNASTAVQREHYLQEAADSLKISMDALRQDMNKLARPSAYRQTRRDEVEPGPKARDKDTFPPEEVGLIELMIAHPEVLDIISRHVPPDAITHPVCRNLMQTIMTLPEMDEVELMRALNEEDEVCRRLAARIRMTARTITSEERSGMHAAQDIILKLRMRLLDRQIRACIERMAQASADEYRILNNESAQLMLLKKQLQRGWEAAMPILELDD